MLARAELHLEQLRGPLRALERRGLPRAIALRDGHPYRIDDLVPVRLPVCIPSDVPIGVMVAMNAPLINRRMSDKQQMRPAQRVLIA